MSHKPEEHEPHDGLDADNITQEEWGAVHCQNGMAYHLKDEFVSELTLNRQVDWAKAVQSFGYSDRKTKFFAKQLEESKVRDLRVAIDTVRHRKAHGTA